jgi:hypothetical protein
MRTLLPRLNFITAAGVLLAGLGLTLALAPGHALAKKPHAPRFEVDASWPKPLPNSWIIGQVGGIAVDQNDNVWIVQRQRSLSNDEAWATEAIEFECLVGGILTLVDDPLLCDVPDDAVPVDGLGNPRPDGPESQCCLPAPAVMQFDEKGNLLQAWGGPADPGFLEDRCNPADGCNWPAGEHGIYVDQNSFVYVAGNGNGTGNCGAGNPCSYASTAGLDGMVLKFSADGTFIRQIGAPIDTILNPDPDSNDTTGGADGSPQLRQPADMEVDPATNELYIADGYGNHRVIVVDAATGLYRRHWGAYGQKPVSDLGDNGDPIGADPNFKNPVHCVRIVGNYVYVCDRVNNRIQVFDKTVAGSADCTPSSPPVQGECGYLGEVFVAVETLGNGSTWDLDTSSDKKQSCLFNPDGTNQRVWILERNMLEILDSFGEGGRSAGQFHWVHNLAADSKGNLYTAEVDTGNRAQRFERKGPKDCKVK